MATCAITPSTSALGSSTHLFKRSTNQLNAHVAYLDSFARELETEAIQDMVAAKRHKRWTDRIAANARVRQDELCRRGLDGLNIALREARVGFLTKGRIAAEKWSVALQARIEVHRLMS